MRDTSGTVRDSIVTEPLQSKVLDRWRVIGRLRIKKGVECCPEVRVTRI